MNHYRYLLFDADGTLFDYVRAERQALEFSLRQFGVTETEPFHNIYKDINISLWLEYEKGSVTKEMLRHLRFKRLFEAFGRQVDSHAFSDAYLLKLSQCPDLIDGAEALCRQLSTNYHLALITNGFAQVQYPRLQASPLAPYFPNVFVSEEMGCQKPDPEYFTKVLSALSVEHPAQVLVIGDSLSADIAGGIRSGLDTCWYNPDHTVQTSLRPTYEIHHLRDLLSHLSLDSTDHHDRQR